MIRTDAHYIGRPVRSLQTMLRALSYVYPFLPRVTPDGVFGDAALYRQAEDRLSSPLPITTAPATRAST